MRNLRIVLIVAFLAAVAVYAVGLAPLEAVMTARGHGIVDLELAWTNSRLATILRDWGSVGLSAARRQIWWDFAFIPAYALTLWSALRLAGGERRWARRAAVGVAVAALCDVVENLCLLVAVGGSRSGAWVALASVMASIKFVLLLVALGVLLGLLVGVLVRRRRA